MGCPMQVCCNKEAQGPNFGPESGAFLHVYFAEIFACFVTQQSRHNHNAFGVPLGINGIQMRVACFAGISVCLETWAESH